MLRRTDTVSLEERSKIMRAVKSHGNKATELALVCLLRQRKITGWRRQFALIGQPDFVFPKQRVALFVDGCFWHGCRWHCRMPASNRRYWLQKIRGNKLRDRRVNRTLRKEGWRVIRIWEHELTRKNADRLAGRIQSFLESPAARR